jgi:hypothetical protein
MSPSVLSRIRPMPSPRFEDLARRHACAPSLFSTYDRKSQNITEISANSAPRGQGDGDDALGEALRQLEAEKEKRAAAEAQAARLASEVRLLRKERRHKKRGRKHISASSVSAGAAAETETETETGVQKAGRLLGAAVAALKRAAEITQCSPKTLERLQKVARETKQDIEKAQREDQLREVIERLRV